jgi:hypothetical protein
MSFSYYVVRLWILCLVAYPSPGQAGGRLHLDMVWYCPCLDVICAALLHLISAWSF